ncbi:MAG: M48 family metallopeptidase [Magnetococcales bacterium]|nr:M48 family metallopeptidase [Magnetococcales bacterium]NGZ28860.1 M48 family metallopeptidase [Magnetococcales bacterium]
MDFFAHQQEARRRTTIFLVLLPLAVLFLMLAAIGVFWLAVVFSMQWLILSYLEDRHYLMVALGTLVIIVVGSVYRMAVLIQGGGQRVARELGGRLVVAGHADPQERRLLNVVEEMAIASSLPVPQVFILDQEEGINAFAAGLSPDNAVIAVTRGTLQQLNRNELQGVVAHEFSHILHGDMRLNVLMMGLLFGIQMFAVAGSALAEREFAIGQVRGDRGTIHLIILGYLLWIAGYVGLFMARMIKGAVSRQREYLADAAAVQFTRNPLGLAGALMKIGGFSMSSTIRNKRAEESSHLFINEKNVRSRYRDWGASHPPLEERIQRLWPAFDGEYPRLRNQEWFGLPDEGMEGEVRLAADSTAKLVDSIGQPKKDHLTQAAAMALAVPQEVRPLLEKEDSAALLVAALLMSESSREIRLQQQKQVEAILGQHTPSVMSITEIVAGLGHHWRLTLLDLAIPILRSWPSQQQQALIKLTVALAQTDGRISWFEYTLTRLLQNALLPKMDVITNPTQWFHSFRKVAEPCGLVMAILARQSHDSEEQAVMAFKEGISQLGIPIHLPPAEACTLAAFDKAIRALQPLSPNYKKLLVEGCCACVMAHGHLSVTAGELLRVVCVLLGCPMPPILADRKDILAS